VTPATQTWIANLGLALAFFGMISVGVYFLANTRDSAAGPRIIHVGRAEPPLDALVAGKPFSVDTQSTIVKACPYEIRWVLTNEHNEAVVYVVEPVRQSPPVGEARVTHEHFMPARVKPGHYKYIAQLFDVCDTRTSVTEQPPIDVTIVK
jgi:hypothetical protein